MSAVSPYIFEDIQAAAVQKRPHSCSPPLSRQYTTALFDDGTGDVEVGFVHFKLS
jgi:hypothetical protein